MKAIAQKSVTTWLLVCSIAMLGIISCRKELKPDPAATVLDDASTGNNKNEHGHLQQAKTYSSEVAISWINKQLDMLRAPLPAGTGAQAQERCMAYCGIALYEAVVPGMPAYQSLYGQLTDFPAMPSTEPGKAYHWAASANAALAGMNRKLFPTTAQVNKDAMTHLEDSLQAVYAGEVDAATLDRSVAFGREVASRVFAWAATDGTAQIALMPAYVAPAPTAEHPGWWIPTAPTPAVNPYAYLRRILTPGVAEGTTLEPPPPYSTVPHSEFWEMAMDTYNKRNHSTADQQDAVRYAWDPGYGPGGGFIAILAQTFNKAKPMLDVAALAYAKVGIAQSDATIICFVNKYNLNFNLIRPITYINKYIDASWTTQIPTPNHPEFPSGHSTINPAVLAMFTNVFGDNFQLTLHTYDYLGYPPRSYNSFEEISIDLANSRVYAGLHYQATCDKSRILGKKIAENILAKLKFLKD